MSDLQVTEEGTHMAGKFFLGNPKTRHSGDLVNRLELGVFWSNAKVIMRRFPPSESPSRKGGKRSKVLSESFVF